MLQHTSSSGRSHEHNATDVLIIGNGIAGLTAALEIRRLAPDKEVMIVTEQPHSTINTPALKQFAAGKISREQLLAYPHGTERTRQIQVLRGRVEDINAQDRFVCLAGGQHIGYNSLVIATGSRPRGLPSEVQGYNLDGVLTLHRLQDYLDLRRRLNDVSDAVVIGSGTHAIETLTSLHYLGIQTHWLIRGRTCLSHTLDVHASELLIKRMEQAGTKVYRETTVAAIAESVGVVAGVVTQHNRMIPCQLVLVCTGSEPVTALAEHCTQPMMHERSRGIWVDHRLRTSVANIYAIGDVAALKNPLKGEYETRAQWYSAVIEGSTVATTITGQHETEQPQTLGVPWHATRLGELSLLTVGNPLSEHQNVTILTDENRSGYRRIAVVDDRLVGYLSVGTTQADGLSLKRIIDEGHSIRSVQESLLKGNFDARQYLTQQRTSMIQAVLQATPPPVVRPIPNPRSLPFPPAPQPVRPHSLLAAQTQASRYNTDELALPHLRTASPPSNDYKKVQEQEQQTISSAANASITSVPIPSPAAPKRLPLPSSSPHVQTRSLLSFMRPGRPLSTEKGM